MSALVAADAVSARIGSKALVRDVTLAIEAGRLTVVIGPNGAGKSTLVKLLSGEMRPSGGRVLYGDEDVRAIAPWRLACLRAVMPQASRLAFPFTVAEVARIGLDGIGRGLSSRDRETLLQDALERADMAAMADRSYQSLSGGEQQRAQFARILAQFGAGRTVVDRQVLLLDEPLSSLDLKHQLALMEAAGALAREGAGILAVLHDLNLAAAFADEIVVMAHGAVAARGAPAEVIDDRMVRDVFEVSLAVGAVPPGGRPFLLPRRIGI